MSAGSALAAGLVAIAAILVGLVADRAPTAIDEHPALKEWASNGNFLNYAGHSLFYTCDSTPGQLDRPAILLLHGFPTSSYDWKEVLPALRQRFRVVALDFLGFGLSAKQAAGPVTIMSSADQALAVLRACSVRTTHILAHDYGDSVAQELISRQAQGTAEGITIESLVLLNGGILPDFHRPVLTQTLLANAWVGPWAQALLGRQLFGIALSRVFGPRAKPSKVALDEWWALVSHNGGRDLPHAQLQYMAERRQHGERWKLALQQTSTPWLLIDGPADPVSGAHLAGAVRDMLAAHDTAPTRSVVVLQLDVGHYPQCEDPCGVMKHAGHFWDSVLPAKQRGSPGVPLGTS